MSDAPETGYIVPIALLTNVVAPDRLPLRATLQGRLAQLRPTLARCQDTK